MSENRSGATQASSTLVVIVASSTNDTEPMARPMMGERTETDERARESEDAEVPSPAPIESIAR